MEENLSVDEQISQLKLEVIWNWNSINGDINYSFYTVSLDFRIISKYIQVKKITDQRLLSEPNLGTCANVVMRLSRCIPENI